jgi:hypothetical protein
MNHIMIDLETMGNYAGCAIVSIGAVQFDPIQKKMGAEFYVTVDLQSCLDAGLRVDAETVYWWIGQSEAARKEICQKGLSLHYALASLSTFIHTYELKYVWSHGSCFDIPILGYCYKITKNDLPWDFRKVRDTRTILDLSGDIIFQDKVSKHHALADAKAQAEAMMRSYHILRRQS